jgi:hypothetical protein
MCQLMDAGKKDIVEVSNQPSLMIRRTNTTCSFPIFDSFWEKAIHNACRRLTSDQFYIDLLPRSYLLSRCNWILHLSFDFFIAWESLTRAAQNWILFLSYLFPVFIARDSLTSATQYWMLHISYPIICLLLPGTVSRDLHSIEYCTYILT